MTTPSRICDSFPCSVYDPESTDPTPFPRVRLVIDRLDKDSHIARIFVWVKGVGLTETARYIGTKYSGSARRGNLVTGTSTLSWNKSGGCGCSDPTKKATIPDLEVV